MLQEWIAQFVPVSFATIMATLGSAPNPIASVHLSKIAGVWHSQEVGQCVHEHWHFGANDRLTIRSQEEVLNGSFRLISDLSEFGVVPSASPQNAFLLLDIASGNKKPDCLGDITQTPATHLVPIILEGNQIHLCDLKKTGVDCNKTYTLTRLLP